jgi:hypothetical protein
MAASIKAVAANCASTPVTIQPNMAGFARGSASPVVIRTTTRNRSANGKPNRNRTCVAPTVPSVLVSPLCMALRRT